MLGFTSFDAAPGTLAGIELMHMLKKKQLVVETGDEALRRLAKITGPFPRSTCYDQLYAEPNDTSHRSEVYHPEAALG